MQIKKITFFIILISIVFSCKESLPVTKGKNNDSPQNNSDIKRYAVGKGGGFTGAYEEYILCEDGQVYKYDFNYDREVLVKNLDQEELNYFLEQIERIGLEGISINEPGNTNYYIEIRQGKLSINKLLWGANQYYPPDDVVKFQKELFEKLAEKE